MKVDGQVHYGTVRFFVFVPNSLGTGFYNFAVVEWHERTRLATRLDQGLNCEQVFLEPRSADAKEFARKHYHAEERDFRPVPSSLGSDMSTEYLRAGCNIQRASITSSGCI